MKLAIVGGRDFSNSVKFEDVISFYFRAVNGKLSVDEIVSGGAKGADALAKKLALSETVTYKEFPANWELYGPAAGPKRNEEIVKYSDQILAFWDGVSTGTKSTINFARKYKKNTIIIYI